MRSPLAPEAIQAPPRPQPSALSFPPTSPQTHAPGRPSLRYVQSSDGLTDALDSAQRYVASSLAPVL